LSPTDVVYRLKRTSRRPAARVAFAELAAQSAPRICGLELAGPEESLSQEQVLGLLGLRGDEFAERIFARCGVRQRDLMLDEGLVQTTLQGRTHAVEDELFAHACKAIERLQIDPDAVGAVVSSTLYSLGGPTLAHRIVEHFGMAPDTDKYHVTGVGCASAVPLLRLAGPALAGRPGKLGLVVAAESMSGILMGAGADDPRAKVVGSAIFGDGCAAALLSHDPRAAGPAVLASKVHQIAGTLDAVALELAASDSYLHLNRDLPDVAAAGLDELLDDFLRDAGIGWGAIDHWLVHPGGRRIIDCVQSALSLSDRDVAVSREVLARHGNVGTPSSFYVLHETVAQRQPGRGERGLVVAIGPGITVGLMLLQW
jgi:predicted naringenin-chalcone synthase